MVKKFLRTLFVLVAYWGIVTPAQCSEDPGFYSEYGDPTVVARLRDMPRVEREARMNRWANYVGTQLAGMHPELKKIEAREIDSREIMMARCAAAGRKDFRDFDAAFRIIRGRTELYHMEPPYTLRNVNAKLRKIVAHYEWTPAEVKEKMMIGVTMKELKIWVFPHAPGFGPSALDPVMKWAMQGSLEEILREAERF